jgi:CheY-like chemotaxis protein
MPLPTPCRVLVVDDHPDTAETFTAIIKSLGHEAQAIMDPHLVPGAIAKFNPHVVFLDIGMPGLDGWTLARRLRETYPAGTIKLVALTAYAMADDRVRSREAGFDAHVAKPVDPDLLASILEQSFAETVRIPPVRRVDDPRG